MGSFPTSDRGPILWDWKLADTSSLSNFWREGRSLGKWRLDFQADRGHRKLELFQAGRLFFVTLRATSILAGACEKHKQRHKTTIAPKVGVRWLIIFCRPECIVLREKTSRRVPSGVGLPLTPGGRCEIRYAKQ